MDTIVAALRVSSAGLQIRPRAICKEIALILVYRVADYRQSIAGAAGGRPHRGRRTGDPPRTLRRLPPRRWPAPRHLSAHPSRRDKHFVGRFDD